MAPPSSTNFADVRRLVSSGAPPALIVSDPAWKRMLNEIDAGLARRKETIDRVAADLDVTLEDKQRPSAPPSGAHPVGHSDGWWPQEAPMAGYSPQQPPPWGGTQGYPPQHVPYPMSQGLPVPPPFPTPPPGFNRHYQTSAQQLPEETELQRRKRQALERMSARPPPVAAAESVQRRSGPDSGYGPAPDPNDKDSIPTEITWCLDGIRVDEKAFEAYRRACWLKYYQHMAALQTPEESDDHHNHQQQQQKQSSTVTPMPHDDDDDEDDDINKELLGL